MAELADAKDLGSFAQQVYRFESCYPHQARGCCTAPRFKWIKDPFKAPGCVAHLCKLKQNAELPFGLLLEGLWPLQIPLELLHLCKAHFFIAVAAIVRSALLAYRALAFF